MYRIHHANLSTGRYLCCPPKVWASCASTSWQDRWRQVKDQASDIILNSIHLDTVLDTLTWTVFMFSLLENNRPNIKPNAIIGVMPLWQDSIYTNGETCHEHWKMCEFLNPGQIHVLGRRSTDTAVHGEEGQAYTLIFLLEFAKNTHQAEIMGIDQPQTSKWFELWDSVRRDWQLS